MWRNDRWGRHLKCGCEAVAGLIGPVTPNTEMPSRCLLVASLAPAVAALRMCLTCNWSLSCPIRQMISSLISRGTALIGRCVISSTVNGKAAGWHLLPLHDTPRWPAGHRPIDASLTLQLAMASPAAPYAVMPEMSPPILERSMLESGYTREKAGGPCPMARQTIRATVSTAAALRPSTRSS